VSRASKLDVTRSVAYVGRRALQFWCPGMRREDHRPSIARPKPFLPSSIEPHGVHGKAATLRRRAGYARKTHLPRVVDRAPRGKGERSEAWSSLMASVGGSSDTLAWFGYEPWHSVRSRGNGPTSNARRSGGQAGIDGRLGDRTCRGIVGGMPTQAWWAVRSSMQDRPARQGLPAVKTSCICLLYTSGGRPWRSGPPRRIVKSSPRRCGLGWAGRCYRRHDGQDRSLLLEEPLELPLRGGPRKHVGRRR